MSAELNNLQAAFEKYVGKSVNFETREAKGKAVKDGKLVEITRKYNLLSNNNPVVDEMQNLANRLQTQVFFKGIVYAGLGGTCVDVDTQDQGNGKHKITKVTARYC
jgi:CTP-dependent riboflavin kinase